MKKKWLIVAGSILVVVVVGIVVSTQFGVTREKEIVVAAPIVEVSPVLTDPANWPRWFGGATAYELDLVNRNPAGVAVKARKGGVRSIFLVSIVPDSVPSRTLVKWTTVMSGYDWLKDKLSSAGESDPGSFLAALKGYFDDPKGFYGFDIQMDHVVDTLVLTMEKTVRKGEVTVRLQGLWNSLASYAAQEHVETNMDSCRMATFYDQKGDSIRIAAGIPMGGDLPRGPEGMRVLEMPAKGKMLVGKFYGPYRDLPRLYGAMRKYIFDKKLVVIGAPYEKFFSRGRSAADSLQMTIELHFPVL